MVLIDTFKCLKYFKTGIKIGVIVIEGRNLLVTKKLAQF